MLFYLSRFAWYVKIFKSCCYGFEMKDGFDNESNKENVLTSMLNGGLRNAGLVEVFRMLILQCAEEPVLLVVISEQGTSFQHSIAHSHITHFLRLRNEMQHNSRYLRRTLQWFPITTNKSNTADLLAHDSYSI